MADDECMDELPPGFRFHPTDEEIVTHYLTPKILDHAFAARAIGEVDLNKCEPWDLPSKAKKIGEKEMYFYCHRDRKYPTGMRTNRATKSGYWKATGKDKEICRGKGVLVGMKKTLVFYKGRAPKGEKTNWIMHEFRLEGKNSLPSLPKSGKDEWVVSRVFHKKLGAAKRSPTPDGILESTSLPPLMDLPNYLDYSSMINIPGSSFLDQDQAALFDFKGFDQNHHQQQQVTTISVNPAHDQSSFLHHDDEAMLRALAAGDNYNEEAAIASSAIIRKHCKVEQCSNQSWGCPSQDTSLSTDHNTTEISSVLSRCDFDDWTTSYGFYS